jgi:hypothetical protein
MKASPDHVAWLDRILGELAALREELVAEEAAGSENDLVDTWQAAERFGVPQDTIRHWCRAEGCGEKRGGRWLASNPLIQRRKAAPK